MARVENIEVKKDEDGIRLDRWFKRYFPNFSHISVEKALRKGDIRIDKKRAKSNTRLQAGQIVRVPPYARQEERGAKATHKATWTKKQEEELQKSVIFKNDDLLVINKPAGIPVQGGSGVKLCIDDMLSCLCFEKTERPKLVHRLDRDTSGVLVLARSASSASSLSVLFKSKNVEKKYIAVLVGVPTKKEGKISNKIGKQGEASGKEKMRSGEEGKVATTFYRVIDRVGDKCSVVELTPVTGRTHQLRVHMAENETPILGDGKYGGKKAFINDVAKRMHLHAFQLKIDFKGKQMSFKADLPSHMQDTIKTFGMFLTDV